jgi:uncharacterized protein with PQ loop repeat
VNGTDILIETIGFGAAALNLFAAAPQILRNIREPDDILRQSLARNLMIVADNSLWVVYGVMHSGLSIIIGCSLNAALNAVLIFQMVARRAKENAAQPPTHQTSTSCEEMK